MIRTGSRTLKTTAAILGVSALAALGSGTAFAGTAAAVGSSTDSYGARTTDHIEHATPGSPKSGDLHSFATPTMATHIAEPSTRYDNNDNSDYRGNNSRYDNNENSGYDSNYDDSNSYDNNNGYYNNYDDNGYYGNGYRHNDNGLLGGGLLGGNN